MRMEIKAIYHEKKAIPTSRVLAKYESSIGRVAYISPDIFGGWSIWVMPKENTKFLFLYPLVKRKNTKK